jgi:hypothetical protein
MFKTISICIKNHFNCRPDPKAPNYPSLAAALTRSRAGAQPGITSDDLAYAELANYLARKPVQLAVNPLMWWKHNAVHFPHLAQLARKYLCVPATSAASERLFSKAGRVITRTRAALHPSTASALVFLKENLDRW